MIYTWPTIIKCKICKVRHTHTRGIVQPNMKCLTLRLMLTARCIDSGLLSGGLGVKKKKTVVQLIKGKCQSQAQTVRLIVDLVD